MSLPVYSSVGAYAPLEPIYKNRFDIEFSDDRLDRNFYKISDNFLYYNVNDDFLPVTDINDMINKKLKIDIKISILDKMGDIIKYIVLYDVRLLKIKNLIDFDYDDDDIIKIKVKYKCKEYNIFNDENEISKYKRKRKLEKINDTI